MALSSAGGGGATCWFTGYIFDTFDELIQMFYARKDSPSIMLLCFRSPLTLGSVQADHR